MPLLLCIICHATVCVYNVPLLLCIICHYLWIPCASITVYYMPLFLYTICASITVYYMPLFVYAMCHIAGHPFAGRIYHLPGVMNSSRNSPGRSSTHLIWSININSYSCNPDEITAWGMLLLINSIHVRNWYCYCFRYLINSIDIKVNWESGEQSFVFMSGAYILICYWLPDNISIVNGVLYFSLN